MMHRRIDLLALRLHGGAGSPVCPLLLSGTSGAPSAPRFASPAEARGPAKSSSDARAKPLLPATLLLVGLIATSLLLAGCEQTQAASDTVKPVQVVPVKGTTVSRVVLTEQAARRIGLQTAPAQSGSVPLAAVVYDRDGSTWVYAAVARLTYERERVTVARVAGDTAMLQAGPPAGTAVVTVGTAELLGSEYGVAGQ